jgi:uncharacterized protein YbcI
VRARDDGLHGHLTRYHDNIVVVVLQDTLTRGELSLAADGRHEAVRRIRREFNAVMRAELVEAVEGLTGCRVEALISGSNIEPDLATELFVLDQPVDGASQPPADHAPA